MIYGNHNKKKGDVVKIARWDDRALLNTAWQMDIPSNSGPSRRSVCELIAEMTFFVVDIDYYERKVHMALMGKLNNGRLAPAKTIKVSVELDETNLIRVGRLN